jgi:integrase/recombinase XerD
LFVYEPRKLPRVLSAEEVLRLLEAAPGAKHKAALSVAYGAGLRAMEVVALKVCDVDSKRMMIRVEQGKGREDRHALAMRGFVFGTKECSSRLRRNRTKEYR